MPDLKEVKVLKQYMVTYDIPDPHLESRMTAGRLLRAVGCTVFHDHKHYDIETDGLKMTLIGYVVE